MACLSEVRLTDSGHRVIPVPEIIIVYHIYHCGPTINTGQLCRHRPLRRSRDWDKGSNLKLVDGGCTPRTTGSPLQYRNLTCLQWQCDPKCRGLYKPIHLIWEDFKGLV